MWGSKKVKSYCRVLRGTVVGMVRHQSVVGECHDQYPFPRASAAPIRLPHDCSGNSKERRRASGFISVQTELRRSEGRMRKRILVVASSPTDCVCGSVWNCTAILFAGRVADRHTVCRAVCPTAVGQKGRLRLQRSRPVPLPRETTVNLEARRRRSPWLPRPSTRRRDSFGAFQTLWV